jgi:hypothetical protein
MGQENRPTSIADEAAGLAPFRLRYLRYESNHPQHNMNSSENGAPNISSPGDLPMSDTTRNFRLRRLDIVR